MSEPAKLIAARDIKEIAKLAVLAVNSWFIPETNWGRISGAIAALISRLVPTRTRSRIECIRLGLGHHQIATPVRDVEVRYLAALYEQRLQLLREYRPVKHARPRNTSRRVNHLFRFHSATSVPTRIIRWRGCRG